VTKPGGWVVLNADDRFVAALARRVRARSRCSRWTPRPLAGRPAASARGRARVRLRGGMLVDLEAGAAPRHRPVADLP